MDSIIVESADSIADYEKIIALADEIWRLHYPSIITSEQIDYMLLKFNTVENLVQAKTKNANTFLFKNQDQILCGYAVTSVRAANNFFLDKFYIHPKYQRKGFGNKALSALFENGKSSFEVTLQVNRKNFSAINFYFKNGFKIKEVKDFDIGEGFWMEDFVMQKKY